MLKSRFGRKRVQTHVESFREYRVGALTVEGEPDQPGAVPLPAVAPKSEGAIVEPPAHAEPPAGAVDADQGNDDEIEPTRRHGVAMSGISRNRDAERTAAGLAGERVEPKPAVGEIDDHRNIEPDTAAPRGGDQRARVGLAVERMVDRDFRARLERRQARDGGGGDPRTPGMLRRIQRAPIAAKLLAQFVLQGKGMAPPACAVLDRCSRPEQQVGLTADT